MYCKVTLELLINILGIIVGVVIITILLGAGGFEKDKISSGNSRKI